METSRYARCRACQITALRGHIWNHQLHTGHRGISSSSESAVDHRSIALAIEGKGFTYIAPEVAALLNWRAK